MRHALGIMGVMAATVLLAVSAAINWQFGYNLGQTEMDKQIYGAASAAADCFKALVPFFFFAAVRNRVWSQAAASAVVWVVVTTYSLASAVGHTAQIRDFNSGQRTVASVSYSALRADLKAAQDQLNWVPQHRPAVSVQADIDSTKLNKYWGWTDSCAKPVDDSGRKFCQKYQALQSELGSANQAAKLNASIKEINAKLAQASGVSAMSDVDPQAAVLAKLVSIVVPGTKVEDVQTALIIMVAVLLEIGSGFGMFVAFASWRIHDRAAPRLPMSAAVPQPVSASAHSAPILAPAAAVASRPRLGGANDNRVASKQLVAPETDVQRFHKERIEVADGASLTATTLYEDYCAWCEEQHKEPLALPTFGREFGELPGVQKAKIAGRVRYIGVGLRSGLLGDEEDKNMPATRAA
jgi:hypothetical protein